MAKFKLSGLSELEKQLTKLGDNAAKKDIVKKAASIVLDQQKEDASRLFNGTGNGADALNIVEERSDSTYAFFDIGINSSNWEECRGLYFQHYGFYSKSPTLWMDDSFNKSKNKANSLIKNEIIKRLKL